MKPLPVPLVFHPLLVLAFAVFAVVFAAGVDVAVPAKDSAAGNNNPQSVINRPGKYGFVDTEGRLLIACQWDYAQGFSNDMARVEKDGKWGFINRKGELVVPCVWDNVGCFWQSDRAEVVKDGKSGAIDRSGKLVVPCLWDSVDRFSEKLAVVKDGDLFGVVDRDGAVLQSPQWSQVGQYGGCYVVKKDGKWGIVGSGGKLMSAPRWDEVSPYEGKMFRVEEKSEGKSKYALIDLNGEVIVADLDEVQSYPLPFYSAGDSRILQIRRGAKWGYVSVDGKLISEPQWDRSSRFIDGYAAVCSGELHSILGEDGKSRSFPGYVIDSMAGGLFKVTDKNTLKVSYLGKDGKLVILCLWDDGSEGFPGSRMAVEIDGKFGLIDRAGNPLGPLLWDEIESDFMEDVMVVSRGGIYGFADGSGRLLDELKWDEIWGGRGGYGAGSKRGEFSVIDRKGRTVATHPWTIESEEGWGYLVASAEKFGFVNSAGKVIVSPEWDEVTCSDQADYVTVRRGGKWGIIDQSGVVISDPVWDEVSGFDARGDRRAGAFFVRRAGKWGTLSRSGELLAEPQWDDFNWCIVELGYCDADPEETARTNTNFGYVVRKGGLSGYVDEHGKMTIPAKFKDLDFVGDLGYVVVDGRYGIYHKSGRVISRAQWQDYQGFEGGMAAVQMPGETGNDSGK